jgi:hypothetical protein
VERIGDYSTVGKRQRGSELTAEFPQQYRHLRGLRGVERREPGERGLVVGEREPQRQQL